jgi:hypothetical protein
VSGECLEVGQVAEATWVNAQGQTCTFKTTVGSDWGINPSNDGDYQCMGRCGAGCDGVAIGNQYTLECLSHDVCSYFSSASGGPVDANCGRAFISAVPSFFSMSCQQSNPVFNSSSVPMSEPVCVDNPSILADESFWTMKYLQVAKSIML